MIFAGLQKLSLLDYPTKTACTVFTSGCNFRCPFCHNASLVLEDGETFTDEQVLDLLEKRRGVLDGIAVTGGEPLMHPELKEFLAEVKRKGFLVKLDTNGSFPERLKEFVNAGIVDRVAMDIKNSPAKYLITAGAPGLDMNKIRESVSFLLSNVVEYEFRTTVVKGFHEKEDFIAIGEWIRGANEYYLQAFVDSGNLIEGEICAGCTEDEMKEFLAAVEPYVKKAALRGV